MRGVMLTIWDERDKVCDHLRDHENENRLQISRYPDFTQRYTDISMRVARLREKLFPVIDLQEYAKHYARLSNIKRLWSL